MAKKLNEIWRFAVRKEFDALPKDIRGDHDAIVAAINKRLPHIPAEAIAEILKEL